MRFYIKCENISTVTNYFIPYEYKEVTIKIFDADVRIFTKDNFNLIFEMNSFPNKPLYVKLIDPPVSTLIIEQNIEN